MFVVIDAPIDRSSGNQSKAARDNFLPPYIVRE